MIKTLGILYLLQECRIKNKVKIRKNFFKKNLLKFQFQLVKDNNKNKVIFINSNYNNK
jgi:hypothetical protein